MLSFHAAHYHGGVGTLERAATTSTGERAVKGHDLLDNLTFLVDGDRVTDDSILNQIRLQAWVNSERQNILN